MSVYAGQVSGQPLFTTQEAADFLKVSPSRIRQLVREGKLEPESLATHIHLFTPTTLENFQTHTRRPSGRPKKS